MRSIILAAVALGLVTGSPALADPGHGHGNHGDEGERGDRGDKGDGDHHDNGKHKGWYKHDDRRYADQRIIDRSGYAAYDYNRPDPRYGNYAPERYYRQGSYPEQRLSQNDRIYRGGDGRYYCRRNDGTTGLLIGALGGGVLGNAIAPRGSKTLGAVLGALGGGIGGRAIDRGGVSCR